MTGFKTIDEYKEAYYPNRTKREKAKFGNASGYEKDYLYGARFGKEQRKKFSMK